MKRLLIVVLALLAPAHAAGPRVVDVHVGRAGAAKGFVAGPGRVVTVAHVLGDGELRVDGRRATVLRRDDHLDLAVLAVPGVDGPRVRVGGASPAVMRRADARVDGSAWRRPVLQLHIEVEDGDSGTPVLSADGRVVGVVFARSQSRPGVAWAVDCRVGSLPCGSSLEP